MKIIIASMAILVVGLSACESRSPEISTAPAPATLIDRYQLVGSETCPVCILDRQTGVLYQRGMAAWYEYSPMTGEMIERPFRRHQ